MAMVIKNNMAAQLTLGELNKNNNKLSKTLKKVSSGMKINSAADDASGYAISERMRVQVRGLDQANANTQNATSLLKTAGGAVESTVDILKTMKEKAIDAANDTNTDLDRATIQKELDQSIDQLDDNAEMTYNGKRLFTGATDYTDDVQQTIIKALYSDWAASSLQLIKDTYGLSFEGDGASVKEIDLQFYTNTTDNVLAQVVSHPDANGVTQALHLQVNLHYYADMNQTDVNGSSASSGSAYLDRTLAHELTHAVMRANIPNMSKMPRYMREGSAELTHGIDDERRSDFLKLHASDFATVFNSSDGGPSQSTTYTIGYTFFRYLQQCGGEGSMQRFMSVMHEQGGAALDAAVAAATRSQYTTLKSLTDQFVSDIQSVEDSGGSNVDFYKKYCSIDLYNRDTGAATGSDAGFGDEETAETIVLEGLSTQEWVFPDAETSTINGLTFDWGELKRPDTGFRFQVGTRANQQIKAAFSDIHAAALGLKSDEGKMLSVSTRANAKRALTILDRAVQKTLNQATTIGAITSRLSYTSSNLTTASENVQSAESTIRDADMAKEMTEFTKNNVLQQAAQSMLAQANQNSSGVLSLLQ
jgi:flagellin